MTPRGRSRRRASTPEPEPAESSAGPEEAAGDPGEVEAAPELADIPEEVIADVVADTDRAALVPVRERGLPVPVDPLRRYIQEVRRIPELTPEEEQRLARLYRETGDRDAAMRLVTANLMLVVKLALMYRRALRNVMDLIQEGNIGLLEALKRYDPGQNVRFTTYAAWWVKAYMLKYLLDNARMVRVGTTNARRKLLYNLRREKDRLAALGVAPTPKLLAERFGVAEADVVDVDRALSSPDMSVDQPISAESELTVAETLASGGPSVEEQVAADEMKEKVERAVAEFRQDLNERERALLDRRIAAVEPTTLQELGDEFGVTREAMRQAENKLKERLAHFLRARLGDEVILYFGGEA